MHSRPSPTRGHTGVSGAARRHLYSIATTLALAALIGWLSGWLWQIFAMLASAYGAWHLVNLVQLERWLAGGTGELPEGSGLWRHTFQRLFHRQRRTDARLQQLRRALREFRTATEAFPEPAITLDEKRTVVWFNPAAERTLGLCRRDDPGQPILNLLRSPAFVEWLDAGGERPMDMESPGDRRVKLNVRHFELSPRRRLLLFRDVTELRNLETVRRDFVANVSHELRTPLTVLTGYLESLDDDTVPELNLIVQRMGAQARLMQNLIDDLIEISRLQAQTLKSRQQPVDMAAMMAQLKEQAESLSDDDHRLEFDCDCDRDLFGAAKDLESAFGNLITNAIRYTPAGGAIHVRWYCEAGQGVFAVSDDGIGIPSEDIPRLTERFYRVSKDRSRSRGGSGLGLSIVKHVLNAHNARLEIDSELGRGSEFRCVFPGQRMLARQPIARSQRA